MLCLGSEADFLQPVHNKQEFERMKWGKSWLECLEGCMLQGWVCGWSNGFDQDRFLNTSSLSLKATIILLLEPRYEKT